MATPNPIKIKISDAGKIKVIVSGALNIKSNDPRMVIERKQ